MMDLSKHETFIKNKFDELQKHVITNEIVKLSIDKAFLETIILYLVIGIYEDVNDLDTNKIDENIYATINCVICHYIYNMYILCDSETDLKVLFKKSMTYVKENIDNIQYLDLITHEKIFELLKKINTNEEFKIIINEMNK